MSSPARSAAVPSTAGSASKSPGQLSIRRQSALLETSVVYTEDEAKAIAADYQEMARQLEAMTLVRNTLDDDLHSLRDTHEQLTHQLLSAQELNIRLASAVKGGADKHIFELAADRDQLRGKLRVAATRLSETEADLRGVKAANVDVVKFLKGKLAAAKAEVAHEQELRALAEGRVMSANAELEAAQADAATQAFEAGALQSKLDYKARFDARRQIISPGYKDATQGFMEGSGPPAVNRAERVIALEARLEAVTAQRDAATKRASELDATERRAAAAERARKKLAAESTGKDRVLAKLRQQLNTITKEVKNNQARDQQLLRLRKQLKDALDEGSRCRARETELRAMFESGGLGQPKAEQLKNERDAALAALKKAEAVGREATASAASRHTQVDKLIAERDAALSAAEAVVQSATGVAEDAATRKVELEEAIATRDSVVTALKTVHSADTERWLAREAELLAELDEISEAQSEQISKLTDTEDELDATKAAMAVAEARVAELDAVVADAEVNAAKSRSEADTLRRHVDSSRSGLSELRDEYTERISALESELVHSRQTESEMIAVQDANAELQGALAVLEARIGDLTADRDARGAELTMARTELAEMADQLSAEVRRGQGLTGEAEATAAESAQAEESNAELVRRLLEAEERLEREQSTLTELRTEVAQLRASQSTLKRDNSSTEHEIANAVADAERYRKEAAAARAETIQAHEQLEATEDELASTSARRQALQAELDQALDELDAADLELDELRSTDALHVEKLDYLTQQNAAERERADHLEEQLLQIQSKPS